MIKKNLQIILEKIPEIKKYLIFFNTGVIIKTDLSDPINISQLGLDLAHISKKLSQLTQHWNVKKEPYRRIVYESLSFKIVIFPLGEESHIAFFLDDIDKDIPAAIIKDQLEELKNAFDASLTEEKNC